MNVLEQYTDLLTAPVELSSGLTLRQLEPTDRQRICGVVDEWWGRPMGALLPRDFFTHFRDSSLVVER